MIDLTNKKWTLSKEEKSIISYFDKQGFSVSIKKQYVSKTIVEIEKDNVSCAFSISQLDKKLGKLSDRIAQYEKNWATAAELQSLREQLKAQGA